MRSSIASIAIIRRQNGQNGHTEWLAQWNTHWAAYSFVGGHKHDDETFRECVIREISEELDLTEGDELTVADEPLARLEFAAWSASALLETHYTMELFETQLVGESVLRQVAADPRNRWLSEAEIRANRTERGEAVSETIGRLLAQANLLPD